MKQDEIRAKPKVESRIFKSLNGTISSIERQKRLLPYVNFYQGYNFNKPQSIIHLQNPEAFTTAKRYPLRQPTRQQNVEVQNTLYLPKGKITPFLESNAIPGPFVPMRRPPQNQPTKVAFIPIQEQTKEPNFSAIYDKLSQLKLQQQDLLSGRYNLQQNGHNLQQEGFKRQKVQEIFKLPDGVKLQVGVRLPEGIKLQEGVKLSEGIRLQEGIRLSEGTRIPEGIRIQEGVKHHNVIRLPENIKLQEGVRISEGVKLQDGLGQNAYHQQPLFNPHKESYLQQYATRKPQYLHLQTIPIRVKTQNSIAQAYAVPNGKQSFEESHQNIPHSQYRQQPVKIYIQDSIPVHEPVQEDAVGNQKVYLTPQKTFIHNGRHRKPVYVFRQKPQIVKVVDDVLLPNNVLEDGQRVVYKQQGVDNVASYEQVSCIFIFYYELS